MRSNEEFEAVVDLCKSGLNDCQVSRLTGVPRTTVRSMRTKGRKGWFRTGRTSADCPRCGSRPLDRQAYAYLLGLYLGDGCIATCPRGVYRLRIALDQKYLGIVGECIQAMEIVRGISVANVGGVEGLGCVEGSSFWKHWPCLFPQHGPGPKWMRDIVLAEWQEEIVKEHPDKLLRGLIHSDGCRDLNWVKGKSYPRYQFKNNSFQIQEIFTWACERVGVHWCRTFWSTISVARRPSVSILDQIVGPKF